MKKCPVCNTKTASLRRIVPKSEKRIYVGKIYICPTCDKTVHLEDVQPLEINPSRPSARK